MAKRYNLCVPRPGAAGKTYWQQIGSLFVNDDGNHSIKLDALPVGEIQDSSGNKKPFDGWIKCFDADKNAGQQSQQRPAPSGQKRPPREDLDDDIPF